MALDGTTLAAIKTEFEDKLVGGRIDKIYQPQDNLLTIKIRQPGKDLKLLVSANSQNPRIHLTDQDFSNPLKPPTFCMLLRKHLESGRIREIRQPKFERILEIVIQYKNSTGELENKILTIELMGRHSNIILTKENKQVLDSIKRVTGKMSRHREILPGKQYKRPPEQGKKNPLTTEKDEFITELKESMNQPLYRAIMNNYRGISPLIAKEIAVRANYDGTKELTSIKQIKNLWSPFAELVTAIKNNDFNPTLIYNDNHKDLTAYAAFDLQQFNSPKEKFKTINQLLNYYYTTRIKQKKINKLTEQIESVIANNKENAYKKYNKVKGQLKGARNAEKYKLKGELITANIYQLEKGQKKVTLNNYYEDNEEVTIELDEDLSPSENAQRYFEKYEKAKTSVKYLKNEVTKAKNEIKYLNQLENNLNNAESIAELEELKKELVEQNYIKEQKSNQNNNQDKKLPPLKFKSSDDYDILVGRNNRQNDKLTKKIANNQDLWFHVKDLAGSHTVVRNHTGKEIPEDTILEAAQIAAYYSKGRQSSKVPVDYTLVKHVNKPKGAKPGMVYYEQQTTLYVDPDEELVQSLKIKDS
ncbi:Rqc2 family fibronectin-binding protein [Halanaerobacter jeridensis]|uniref:Rqc2 homolog RqcH n=1 Tax=Halanaerobacter jeridensis TaxID=706427 RepID=A0A938XNL1_9FIRM|nr:NFACT RNA binding domain-containing protein [Halanaerobacter jeridensis]MBM7555943.1 putative ribosome quality control (RQC) complex YloA/Tae2 family protein [Halanaerobacter jeridensis]